MGVQGSSVGTPAIAGMLVTVNGARTIPMNRNAIITYLYPRVPTDLPPDTLLVGANYVGNRAIDTLTRA